MGFVENLPMSLVADAVQAAFEQASATRKAQFLLWVKLARGSISRDPDYPFDGILRPWHMGPGPIQKTLQELYERAKVTGQEILLVAALGPLAPQEWVDAAAQQGCGFCKTGVGDGRLAAIEEALNHWFLMIQGGILSPEVKEKIMECWRLMGMGKNLILSLNGDRGGLYTGNK